MYCDKLFKQAIVSSNKPIVQTTKGKVAGIEKNGSYIFRGVKYAKARRFHMPEIIEKWNGVKAAVSYGYVCPEMITPVPTDALFNPHYYMPQDEDCQYLNIWTKHIEKDAKRPVMVWMHGGGWTSGSSVEQVAYDGEELSKYGDVVVVSFNHRHNCLGGLDLSDYGDNYEMSAYCSLGDIIMLLKWVHDNIYAFGGDPDNVMLFGQSGGVAKILYVMQCPEADGLYSKVAIDSGGIKEQIIPEGWSKKSMARRLAALTVANLGLNKKTIKMIEDVPYWELADAVMKAEGVLRKESGLCQPYRWEPIEDGKYVIGSTLRNGFRRETINIPMLIGNVFGEANSNIIEKNLIADGNKNKWDLELAIKYINEKFGNKSDRIIEEFRKVYPENKVQDVLFMDYEERNGQLEFVKHRVELGAEVWNWLFKKESSINGGSVAWHCSEIPYIFHNTSFIPSAYDPGVSEKLEEIMCTAWITFAKKGNPNDGKIVPTWEKVSADYIPTMIFDKECSVRLNHDEKLRQILQEKENGKWEN